MHGQQNLKKYTQNALILLQQRLSERATMLSHTHTANAVIFTVGFATKNSVYFRSVSVCHYNSYNQPLFFPTQHSRLVFLVVATCSLSGTS